MWNNAIFYGWASLLAVAFALPKLERPETKLLRLVGLSVALGVLWYAYSYYDNASKRDVGSFLVQIAAASAFSILLVLWLKAALSGPQPEQDEKVLAAREARFKLITVSIACIVLARTATPYLDGWAKRTSGLEVGVFKLAMFEPRKSGRDLELTALGGRNIGDDATRASGALGKVIELGVGSKETVSSAKMEFGAAVLSAGTYGQKAKIVRDFLITRFLASNNPAANRVTPSKVLNQFGNAESFNMSIINDGISEDFQLFEKNFAFARELAIPLRCVEAAAKLTRDYRLVMLDVHPLIRWMMRLSIEDRKPNATPGQGSDQAANAHAEDEQLAENIKGWTGLLDKAGLTYRGFVGSDPSSLAEVNNVCSLENAKLIFFHLRLLSGDLDPSGEQEHDMLKLTAIRKGPYPTMAAAWLLGGIGGTEAAISVLARWLTLSSVYSGTAAESPSEIWLYSRALIELDLLIPDDLIDSGNEMIDRLYEAMFSSIRTKIPEFFEYYGSSICAVSPQINERKSREDERTFREVEQAFYQSLATIRVRSYRAKIGLSRPGSRVITDDIIDEAKKIANTRHECFPLVEGYGEKKELYLGQQAAYVGYLQKAYVDSRIRSQITEDQTRRLKEARTYFHRAQDLLEQFQSHPHGIAALANTIPEKPTRLERLAPSTTEMSILSGAGPANPELTRITRALLAIDQIVGEE